MAESVTIGMTPAQWQSLIDVLSDIAGNLPLSNYTLIGAVDWWWVPVIVLGFFFVLGYIHQDLKAVMLRQEDIMKEEKKEREKRLKLAREASNLINHG